MISRTVGYFRLFPLPIIAVLLAYPPLGHAQGTGYWHAQGSQIVDANGEAVRIAGINWYGFETTDEVVHGLSSQDYKVIMANIKKLGYNTLRLPFSSQMVESPILPSHINFSNGMNSGLGGLNSLQIMDKIVQEAGVVGLKIILDNHRSEAGSSAEASGLWYTGRYPETNWIADWKALVTRYDSDVDANGNPVIIGVDLRNEPHNATSGGACWTGDSAVGGCPASNTSHNWPAAAARAGDAVLAINPKLLIFVEGVDEYNNDYGWWGGNLEGAENNPVTLSLSSQLVYSAHDYGPQDYGQSWFNSSTTPASLDAIWTKFWAYLSINDTAPVWLGEFGTDNSSNNIENSAAGSQGQWFQSLVSFLHSNPKVSWTYWALNGEDRDGLLDANYDAAPANALKQQELASIQFPLSSSGTGGTCSAAPATPTALTATAASASQINLQWGTVASPTYCTVSYRVFRSISSGFAATAANQIANGLTTNSYSDKSVSASTTYYYAVKATDSYGSSTQSAQASAKTQAGTSQSGCHIAYAITNQWGGGFQAAVSIQNTSSTPLNSWVLMWTFPNSQAISSLWSANYSQTGEAVIASNQSYNGTIAAGATYTGVGFTANFSGSNAVPSTFTLNGVVCK